MPKLWKFRKAEQTAVKVEDYQFAEAQSLPAFDDDDLADLPEPDELDEDLIDESLAAELLELTREKPEEPPEEANPVSFAQIQCDKLIQDAEVQAAEIVANAEAQAQKIRDLAREKGHEEGYQAGYHQGMAEGTAQALEEGDRAKEETARRMMNDVDAFLDRAEQALNRQMDENLDDLRDLALAVAEKVVCVSLKSSSEVVGRMIQTAVTKRKRREWAHIYIAECDAKRLTTMPATLSAALAELSDRVQIIPMAGDEAGTCIIESPNEIIDASASTQMQNIRDMLSSRPGGGGIRF